MCTRLYVDDVSDVMTPDKQNVNITTATTTDIVASPASGVRNVKWISIRNAHASTSVVVTLQIDVGGTLYQLMKATLVASEVLACQEGTWTHYDTNGAPYPYTAQPQIDRQVFTATGSNTWNMPTIFTPKKVSVKLWGGGGGGGAGASLATATVAPGDWVAVAAPIPSRSSARRTSRAR